LEKLRQDGVLSAADLEGGPTFPGHEVDYGSVIKFRAPLLKKAFENFKIKASSEDWNEFEAFCQQNTTWLEDYALFMAVKEAHGGAVWDQWEPAIAARRPAAISQWSEKLGHEMQSRKYWQHQFFKQWSALKQDCHRHRIKVMGDLPIFVAHDSADVWAHPELFELDTQGKPTVVAGVPPDYFSATGQLWGNPLYRWNKLAETGYAWWIERFRAMLTMVDIVRLDHFRGFEAYWEVPATETTAINGRWVKGPGAAFFQAIQKALGELPIVAENLGVITPEVESLRERFGFPGMAVLQFAFGTDLHAADFLPHNYPRNCVVYTGTHDNDTTLGWWTSAGVLDSTRSQEEILKEREFALKYLGSDGREIHWAFIRCILASVADIAITPLQDIMGLGSEARMNLPARPSGNWRWRYAAELLTDEIRERLRRLTEIYGRSSPPRIKG
jgi:4-alpha-glucanotransferase